MSSAATVTLLFTDVVGSTALLERLGDDRAEVVRRRHFRLLRDAARAHGGEEVKSLGDGLMVVFPSAVNAVTAAVAIQQAVELESRERHETALQVRVGLHVGDPIRDEEDYFGTPVVVARRLCDAAGPGEILASDLVRALVGNRGDHTFDPRGPLPLKGLREPVNACGVAWEPVGRRTTPLPPLLAPKPSPFIGRVTERERIDAARRRSLEGRRELVVIAGEPGIGKTRLAAEAARAAHAEGAVVLYGRCYEEPLTPYQPFVEALRHYAASLPTDDLAARLGPGAPELTRVLPELHERVPDLGEPLRADPEAERYRLFEAVAALLAEAGRQAPVMLVLDDLQWADTPSLLLLKHVVRAGTPEPVCVVATYRDTELGRTHPLAATLADIRREHAYERVTLSGLPVHDVVALVEAWAGPGARADLVGVVADRTDGNPFFVEELLHHLKESGAIGGGGRLLTGPESIPEGVRDVIGRRLSRLTETANRVLAVASVIGREFRVEPLRRVTGLDEEDLLVALEEAAAARVINDLPWPADGYSFSHALVRDTLYGEHSRARRQRLHRQIGEALEQIHANELDSHFAELAHHFAAAADADVARAIDYGGKAGDRALAQLAYEEAARHYEEALELLDHWAPRDDTARCRLLLGVGETQQRAGDVPEARLTYQRAAELARATRSADLLARAALGVAGARSEGGVTADPAVVALLEEALDALPGDDSPLRARLLARLASELYYTSAERREQLSAEAVAMAERLGDPGLLASVLGARHQSLWDPHHLDDRLQIAAEIVSLATRTGDREQVLWGRIWRVVDLLEVGDLPAARAEIDAYTALAEEMRQPYFLWYPVLWKAMLALYEGRFDEGEREALRALEIGQKTWGQTAIQSFGAQLMAVRREQGRVGELEPLVRGFVEQYPAVPGWRSGLALAHTELGNAEEARVHFEVLAADSFAGLPHDVNWVPGLSILGQVCAFIGDRGRAPVLYDLLLPYADRAVVFGSGAVCSGSGARILALLATAMERWDDAERHFETAIAFNRRMGGLPYVARTQLEYARMLLARGAAGDRERAGGVLAEALEIARRLDMPTIVERIEQLTAVA